MEHRRIDWTLVGMSYTLVSMLLSSARIRRYFWLINLSLIGLVVGASVPASSKLLPLQAETCDLEADEKEIEVDDLVDLIKPNLSASATLVLTPGVYGHFFEEPVENLEDFSIGHLKRGPPCC